MLLRSGPQGQNKLKLNKPPDIIHYINCFVYIFLYNHISSHLWGHFVCEQYWVNPGSCTYHHDSTQQETGLHLKHLRSECTHPQSLIVGLDIHVLMGSLC